MDGYAGFKSLAESCADGSVRLAFCWAHMRRPFYEFFVSTQSPLAAEVRGGRLGRDSVSASLSGASAGCHRVLVPGRHAGRA